MKKLISMLLAGLITLLPLSGCCFNRTLLSPDEPVTLTMWHVYGEQVDSPMNRLIREFNSTIGRDKGIIIDVTLMSNSAQIGEKLAKSQAELPGEPDMPDLFFAHPSNAAALGADKLIDWNDCFSEEELTQYVPEFLSEGIVDGRMIVFPVSKSTHLLFLNGSQFQRFSRDTGVVPEDLATWEGFFDAAEKYCDWSGGHAFCAIDYLMRAVELYALSGGKEVAVQNDWYDTEDEVLRRAWEPFAEALVKGHICVSDLYANTQVMTGEVLAGLSSSAAILYYNDVVTYPDNTSEPMELMVLPSPQPAGKPAYITQAGVGLCSYKTTEQKAEAASAFAHWLTEPERNLDFVADTGYLPVNKESFEQMEDYPFKDGYAELFSALKDSMENATAVVETASEEYYDRVHQFYSELRSGQQEFTRRYQSGESAEDLAEETWRLLCGN